MKRKQRTTDPALLAAHDEAWKAYKALPASIRVEELHAKLLDLSTWHPGTQTLAEHTARYDAGKPQELWAEINRLNAELYKTPENKRWFELYESLYAASPQPVGTTAATKSPITQGTTSGIGISLHSDQGPKLETKIVQGPISQMLGRQKR